ncbi:MAG: hypothetical protein R6U68_08690, partial [Desulfobacteraceae bacterium]
TTKHTKGTKNIKIMGQICKKAFMPDLIHVLNNAYVFNYIFGYAITALNALVESADELILLAPQTRVHKVADWDRLCADQPNEDDPPLDDNPCQCPVTPPENAVRIETASEEDSLSAACPVRRSWGDGAIIDRRR